MTALRSTELPSATRRLRNYLGAKIDRRPSRAARRLGKHFANGGWPVVLTDQYHVRFVLHARDLDDVDELLSKSFYKPDFRAIEKLLAPGDTAVDVGANVGSHSIVMGRRVGEGGRVIAFEPIPSTAWAMRENLALNRIENVQLIEAAISDAPGKIEMNVFDQRYSAWNSRGAPTIAGIAPVATVGVRADCLDDALRACAVERVNFLKIDVEGYELDALKGAERLLVEGAIDGICFEVSQVPLEASGHKASELFELLASCGYRSYKFDESRDCFVGPFADSNDPYANFYASRRDLRTLQ